MNPNLFRSVEFYQRRYHNYATVFFSVLVGTLLLLIFIGEVLRDALDPRKR